MCAARPSLSPESFRRVVLEAGLTFCGRHSITSASYISETRRRTLSAVLLSLARRLSPPYRVGREVYLHPRLTAAGMNVLRGMVERAKQQVKKVFCRTAASLCSGALSGTQTFGERWPLLSKIYVSNLSLPAFSSRGLPVCLASHPRTLSFFLNAPPSVCKTLCSIDLLLL